jgi:ornithine carbamoyltransferase
MKVENGDPLPALPPLNITWIGDSNNILNSMLVTYPRLGLNVRVATPNGYDVDESVLKKIEIFKEQKEFTGSIEFSNDPLEVIKDSDVIVTDTWISMGQEAEKEKRLVDFKGFQVTEQLAIDGGAKSNWKFLHCLPRKKYEVDDEVFYNRRSLVYAEAENRKYTVMAVFEHLMF